MRVLLTRTTESGESESMPAIDVWHRDEILVSGKEGGDKLTIKVARSPLKEWLIYRFTKGSK